VGRSLKVTQRGQKEQNIMSVESISLLCTYMLPEAYHHVLGLLQRLPTPNQSQEKCKHCWPEWTRQDLAMILCCITK